MIAETTSSPYAMRVAIQAELVEFKEILRSFPSDDEMTVAIRGWYRSFKDSLRAETILPVIDLHISLLREILIDCKTFTPLDSKALLGTDHRTYGGKALPIVLSGIPEKDHFLSPFNPSDGVVFTVKPHPVARHSATWLKSHSQGYQNPELKRVYKDLKARGLLPELPTEEYRAMLDEIRQIQEEMLPQTGFDDSDELFNQELECTRNAIIEAQTRIFSELDAQMNAIVENGRERRAVCASEMDQNFALLTSAFETLEREGVLLNEQSEALETVIQDTTGKVSEASKNIARVRKGINEARQEDRKRKRAWLTALKIAGIGGFGYLGTIGLKAAFSYFEIPLKAAFQQAPAGGMIKIGQWLA